MSNLPPNPYTSAPGALGMNAFPGQQMLNHNQLPPNQPGYTGLKQDANSNSPIHAPTPPGQNSTLPGQHNMNNYHQSANSSPAFNRPGIMPSSSTLPPSMLPPNTPMHSPAPIPSQYSNSPLPPSAPLATSSPRPGTNINNTTYPPNFPVQGKQINDNAPPLIPSSQAYNQPIVNGPPSSGPPTMQLPPSSAPSQYPPSSRAFSPQMGGLPQTSASNFGPPGPIQQSYGPPQPGVPKPPQASSQPNVPFSGTPLSAIPRNSPIVSGPAVSGPPLASSRPIGVNGPPISASIPPTGPLSQPSSFMGLPKGQMSSGAALGPPNGPNTGPPSMASMGPPMTVQSNSMSPPSMPPSSQPYLDLSRNGPQAPGLPTGPPSGPPTGLTGPQTTTHFSGPPTGPQSLPPMAPSTGLQNAPPMGAQGGPPTGRPMGPSMPPMGLQSGPTSLPPTGPPMGPQSYPTQPPGLQSGPQSLPQVPRQMPLGGPLPPQMSNMQNRYPAMPQSNYNQNAQISQPPRPPYPQQYNAQGLTQQMGNLSVTKQGFDQLWGHQNIDLLQCRHILPEYPEDPPEIRLGSQFADSPNCSPEIFRCTVNRIPETNSLLQKCRLPLGILIHPFKDLNHLPVIQCASIVRCRACRTYINPFVYFLDSKRWKCNLCYRVNDLPEEFQYDPVSKSYGDPSRRPEIKSATIEFIAPAEYMLRPPQPAVYLFLLDVSQLARESGYLDVLCSTLKASLSALPGDARTQVGFVCFDSHVHYYLMSEGLTRPKEMTVLDIDDVFLPSPESLLVNLNERSELIMELLTVLPTRYSTPGVPSSALGAALQAAYKLMAPTGGRITVFQTCLPNIGPGALQPREDPNARSSKDVAHLNPATDFYKRLALDCSGAQISVDLFLLNSQYSDLATLSGMSKFSAGSVHHIPLFSAARSWQADQFRRMLQRYLTRKIGFEAVMRVRATRGISIHTFHGNFFVRSTDLLSLPNVSPDAGFGMQLTIDESLSDLQQVCFQAALLYTSSKGERRIRVHTLALPIASTLPDVLHSADQQCIIGLLSKMAVDRCASASMSEAREALMNVAVDALSAHRLAQNLPAGAASGSLHAPASLRLLPLYLLATLKRKAFRVGTSTRLDDRVADMCDMKTLPLPQLLRAIYPDLYPIHNLEAHEPAPDEDDAGPDPPRLQLSAERVNSTGAYLLDDGETMMIYVCHAVSPAFLSDTFGVTSFSQLPDEARTLPRIESEGNHLLHAFIDKLNDDRPYPSNLLLLRDNSTSRLQFTERLVDDRVESAFSYYEFLQHIKSQVK